MDWISIIPESVQYIENHITDGATPTAVRKGEKTLKTFAPLKVKIVLEGGYLLDYKIVSKEAFSIIGVSKTFEDDIDGNGRKRLLCGHLFCRYNGG